MAIRNEGDARTAGWVDSNAQGIEVGPDGKLYFSTAFGVPAREGVFSVNTDGTSFVQFLPQIGNSAAGSWELRNARDLEWSQGTLCVSARGGFNETNRPVYAFNTMGELTGIVSTELVGPQGLVGSGDDLLVTGTVNPGLASLDLTTAFPVVPISLGTGAAIAGLDVIDLNGDIYTISHNTGPGTVGQIRRLNANGTSTVVENLPVFGNDLAIFGGDDPLGSLFAITLSGNAATGFTLTFPSAAGVSFEVHSSPDLMDWNTIETTIVGQPAQETASWTTPPVTGGKKFYRIQFSR